MLKNTDVAMECLDGTEVVNWLVHLFLFVEGLFMRKDGGGLCRDNGLGIVTNALGFDIRCTMKRIIGKFKESRQ